VAEEQISQDFKAWVEESDMPAGKKKVVLAALKLFSEKGFDVTATQEIAKESGMSQATIFKYFKTKEDLLNFIIEPLMDNIIPVYVDDFQLSLEEREANLEDLVHYVVRSRYNFLVDNREVASIVLAEILTKDDVKTKFIQMLGERGAAIGHIFIDLATKTGVVRNDVTLGSLIRILVSQILVYFLQNYKIFTPVSKEQEDKDLSEIEKLVISAIQKPAN
jgi:AcrR family transcriptional regulator